MAGANTLHFTSENFSTEVLQSSVPVLVDFWAEWCAPCVALGPTIDQLADEYKGKVKVGKLNVSEEERLAAQYGVHSIPTVLLFRDGQPVQRVVGQRQKPDYKKILDATLTTV